MNDKSIIHIPIDGFDLDGELAIPHGAKGLVIFAHGSGSSRHSIRNKSVASEINSQSIATLLVDLLSEKEDVDYETRFDINLLTKRLVLITNWVMHDVRTKNMTIGYFGASTGAAASIIAAGRKNKNIKAVVSRGGRVDLAYENIKELIAPTLLIVGQKDSGVLEANQAIFKEMICKKDLVIIPNATHLFEEPGAIESVAKIAAGWFKQNL